MIATVNDVTNGTADGGAGDDLLEVNDVHGAETAVLTDGVGSDTFDLLVRNASGVDEVPFTRITDFNAEEDILQIGSYDSNRSVKSLEIVEDVDACHTDIRVTFTQVSDLEPCLAVIRLDGVTGLTEDQIEITD